MSGRFPGGANSPELLWNTLKSGVDAVTEAKGDRWDLGWHHPDPQRQGRVYTKAGGYLDNIDKFDAEFFGISPREARQVDPQQRLLLELAWEAYEDAGICPRSEAGANTGVWVGISSNDYAMLVGPAWPDAYSNTGSSFSIAANRISYIFDLHGPSAAVDTACSSSIVCVHQACISLLGGECTMALAGGVSLLTSIRAWLGFARASMLSPTGRCKSFDASGDGYVRSEGGGLVLLKKLEDAERDGDRILGVILASGVNSDGRTMGLSMPNGEAQEALLRKLYGQSGVEPEEVFYVEAHGTGTAVGDPIECGALGRVLGQPRRDGSKCLVGSVKSNIGHLEAASGIAGLTKLMLILKKGEIPGNLHFNTPNPKIEFEDWKLGVVTSATPLPKKGRLVMGINSFGFGGTNAHLVIERYRASTKKKSRTPELEKETRTVLVISASSEASLLALAGRYAETLRDPHSGGWNTICAGAARCRSLLRYRLAVTAASKEEATAKLEEYIAGKAAAGLATGSCAAKSIPLAFVYSGNGPQWWGMGRELLAENAIFREEVEAVDAIFAPLAGWSLLEEMRKTESENRIARTEVAQPLLFAQQLGLTQVLRAAGINASAVLGHSVGEVAAAWACGALTREQATRVLYHRSMEQAKTAGSGKMAAVGASPEEVLEAIKKVDGWLELAATNSPQSVTVAGDAATLEQFVQAMTAAGKFARILQLNYPFHTKAMDPIEAGLGEALRGLQPSENAIPFISTVEGTEIEGKKLNGSYWFRNVRQPVRFHESVAHLLKERGFTLFLEIGPHPVLKDYVLQTAKSGEMAVVALPTLKRPGPQGPEPESENLATAISGVYANGGVDVEKLFTRPSPPPELPLYPWQFVRHWRGAMPLPDTFIPWERDHPLLGGRVPSSDGLWENTADVNLHSYLQDHVVQDSVLFPAAGYVELALAGARLALGKGTLDVETFEILRPLAIPAHGDPILQTSVDTHDGTLEIRSRADRDAVEWTRHARGRVSRLESGEAGKLNLEEISSRMPVSIGMEEHYLGASKRGLDYGPMFRGVSQVWLTSPHASQREALAEIKLPALSAAELDQYLAHPSLLDSCLQVFVTLIGQNEKRNVCTVPVMLDRVRSISPLTTHMVCHVIMRRESERSAVADFRVTDAGGNLLLTIKGARCQKVDFRAPASAPLTSEWWRPDTSAVSFKPSSPLPSPASIASATADEIKTITEECGREEFYRDFRPHMERLLGAFAVQAIAALKPGDASFDLLRLARKGGVKRDQAGLLAKLVRIAEEDGQLIKIDPNGSWRWNGERVPESPQILWRERFEAYPRYQAELLLAAQFGESLAAKLQGEDAAEASSALRDQLYDSSPFQAPYNRMARAAVEQLVAAWPTNRPLRILEIAGGGGGTAAWLLPILPAERADYLFTDPSEAVVGRADHRFAAHRFARFAILDLSRDFVEQGQPAGYFDLVIAANPIFDSATTLRDLLTRLGHLMTSDAQVLIIQANHDRFSHLVLDQAARPWSEELIRAGFEAPLFLDDSPACKERESTQQSVLLACRVAVSDVESAARGIIDPAIVGPVTETAAITVPRRYLLVFELNEGSETFRQALEESLATQARTVSAHSFSGREEDLEQRIAGMLQQNPADELIYILAPETSNVLVTEQARCMIALGIVQALEKTKQESPCRVTFVTRGAFPTGNGQAPLDPGQSPVWGLGRVIGNEHPLLHLRLIDLHCTLNNAEDAGWLAAELLRRDDETEVQLSAGHRYVGRERLNTITDLARNAGAESSSFKLDFVAPGGLDSLYLSAAERKAPAADEVEIAIKAAGLNFRDVLWAMGMLPEEAVEQGFSGPTIGMECAGEVVRVGSDVTTVKPGDRVASFASDCFASHVTTDANSVAPIPEGIDFASAATIPTAFLTAYYAFDYLGRLEPGETVLIHGAAGGVGLAAIQIAKLKGAKVIGTAGSAHKRRMLELLGVEHALNSRSLNFADDVMKITGGVGVDVVLNSLAGEAITKSLQCLRPFGRFLEIGKRDLYANSRIGLRPFRNNLSYFGIDADTLIMERPDLARSLFRKVMAHFAAGELRPLPFQEVPISRANEAFRAMQQSRHVGKLVLTMQSDKLAALPVVRSAGVIKPNATYLVTGGLGGFGLATAHWLLEQGATSLALVSRRGAATEEATSGIAKLEAMGATVRAFAADVSDADSLAAVLNTIRAEMAPLTGVIHSAAVIEDAPILNLGAEQLDHVFRPKLLGAWNLHQATLTDALDLFVLYSSSAAVVGNPGQGAYVAANLYLDALALYRRSQGLPALSIGWGAIKDAGFLTRHEAVAGMLKSRTGLDATPANEALADLGRLSAVGATRVSVGRFDMQRVSQMLASVRVPRFMPILPKGAAANLQAQETLAELLQKTPAGDRRALILNRVREHGARVLGTSSAQINVEQPLSELGLDSLMAVELAGGLERELGQPISVMQMLSAGSLAAIAELVGKMLGMSEEADASVGPSDKRAAVLQETRV